VTGLNQDSSIPHNATGKFRSTARRSPWHLLMPREVLCSRVVLCGGGELDLSNDWQVLASPSVSVRRLMHSRVFSKS